MPHYGFNLTWMFSIEREGIPEPVDEPSLDFIARHGFNYIRFPLDYRFFMDPETYAIRDDKALELLDAYVNACRDRKLHACVNLHRAPGFCINKPEIERHNLWQDEEAQAAFVEFFGLLADRYHDWGPEEISFNLINEPRRIDDDASDRKGHDQLARGTVERIRASRPDRTVVIDGWNVGWTPLPELADLNCIQSTRGYAPGQISHYAAPWSKNAHKFPYPSYPFTAEDGTLWNKDHLHKRYAPWREIAAQGIPVHVGECGCYNKTPNDVAMAWMTDLFGLYREYGWGWALWGFKGPFGIVEHGRPGAVYEELDGFKVDRAFFDMLLSSRV